MIFIATSSELAAFCAACAEHPFVTVDTEFLRETTYYPKLCLIQMAHADEVALIDPLAEGLELAPFFELMRNSGVTKVFHAARQDLEIIWNMAQLVPAPLFDTQVAAMVCGYGDQVSYETLAAGLAGAKIDKSSRFTDWSRRPLSEAQLIYAAADVTHLRVVYDKLHARLEKTGRIEWLAEEMAILSSPETYKGDPDGAWQRVKARLRKPRDLAVLKEVAAWREREAQARDVPRGRILRDDLIAEIVTAAPKTAEELSRLRGLANGFERSRAAGDLVAAVNRALAIPADALPPLEPERRGGNGAGALVSLLKVLLQSAAEKHQVAAKILATQDDLDAIATEDEPETPILQGWRREIFGEDALALKNGRIALSVNKGRVVTTRLPD